MDRDEAVRKAEKLLRQGNLAAAITEYARVAAAHPHDLPTLNKLGELYQRAGQTSDAIAQFERVADQWLRDGLYPKAASHYKKILKLNPQDESAMLQLVQASIRQGQLDDAKTWLRTAREGRIARDDRAGADDLTLKLSDLDPTDFDARMTALRVRLGRERSPELVAEVRGVITELERQGRSDETETLLASLIRLDPDDVDARVRVARAAMRRDDLPAARAALPIDTAGSERYEVIALAAELELMAGNVDAGQPLLQRMLSVDREHAIPEIIALGDRLFAREPQAAQGLRAAQAGGAQPVDAASVEGAGNDRRVSFVCVESVVEHHASAREFAEAAARLNGFLTRSPRHVPALLRLVEVCVDGDLDAEATAASGQLADAYLRIGEASKARVIAEDLLIREPHALAHRSRLRRTLVALGETDVDAIILDILTEQLGEDAEGLDDLGDVDDLGDLGDVDEAGDVGLGAAAAAATHADVGSPVDEGGLTDAPFVPGEGDLLETPEPAWSSESGLLFEPMDLGGWADRASAIEPPPPGTVSSDGAPGASAGTRTATRRAGAAAGAGAGAAGGRRVRKKKPAPTAEVEAQVPSPEPAEPVGDLADEIDLTDALNALAQSGTSMSEAPDGAAPGSADPAAQDASTQDAGAGADGEDEEYDEDDEADEEDLPYGEDHEDLEPGAGDVAAPGASAASGIAATRASAGVTNGTGADQAGGEDDDLEQVFDGLRAQAAGDMVDMAQPDLSARLLSMAETYQAAGMYEEARAALEQVATDSRHRFRAAAALGQLFWQQGDPDAALRWLELASEAPAPDPEAGRVVMYELAEKLERTGETTRALAVFLDLMAEQDDYRDVRARVDRLTRVQAEG